MVWSTESYTNLSPPPIDDVAANALVSEQNNLVLASGQVPAQGTTDQLSKAVTHLVAGADFYIGSGGPNDYILTPVAPRIAPIAYFDGMRVRFVVPSTNTGAAVSINVDGLGATVVSLQDANIPAARDLLVNNEVEMVLRAGTFVITSPMDSLILGAKAFVAFEGEPLVPVISLSKNISSVTRNGADGSGQYDVTLLNPFDSSIYIVLTNSGGVPSGAQENTTINATILSPTLVRINSDDPSGVDIDCDFIYAAFFGVIA